MLWSPHDRQPRDAPRLRRAIAAAIGKPKRAGPSSRRCRPRRRTSAPTTAPHQGPRLLRGQRSRPDAGSGTILDAMIRLAGGKSVAGDDPRPNVSLSPEAVVAVDPEVIILGPFAESVESVRSRPGWEQTAAVKSGRVYKVPEDKRYVVLGSPRCVAGLRGDPPSLDPSRTGRAEQVRPLALTALGRRPRGDRAHAPRGRALAHGRRRPRAPGRGAPRSRASLRTRRGHAVSPRVAREQPPAAARRRSRLRRERARGRGLLAPGAPAQPAREPDGDRDVAGGGLRQGPRRPRGARLRRVDRALVRDAAASRRCSSSRSRGRARGCRRSRSCSWGST